ncbi:hypothetical protein P8452_41810 [Trifolium repens]|nr:hypothetical protein P8452_41810 [Trifolium repens]
MKNLCDSFGVCSFNLSKQSSQKILMGICLNSCQSSLSFQGCSWRVLHYLKGALGQGMFFIRTSSFELHGYSDSDRAGCPDFRCSVCGYCFL